AFRARSLAAPEVEAFARRNVPAPPAAWPPRAWDLETLTLVAFCYHPDLDAARAEVRIADAGVVSAGERPDPTLEVSPAYAFNPELGASPYTLGFSLDVPIETAGKRGDRIARAERLGEAARVELARAAWQVRSRLRAALVEHLVAKDALEAL